MGKHYIKSSSKHPYQLAKEATSPEPIEWIKVSKEWIEKFGGKVAKKALLK